MKHEYEKRRERNDRSRNEAKHNAERWTEAEVEVLQSEWTTVTQDLEALASLLGRTVEACRQKHYELNRSPEQVAAEEKLNRVGAWTKGFTSLEDMGY